MPKIWEIYGSLWFIFACSLMHLTFHQTYHFTMSLITKQFVSVDSPSWAERKSTDDFVVACMVAEIFYVLFDCWRLDFSDFYEWILCNWPWYNKINCIVICFTRNQLCIRIMSYFRIKSVKFPLLWTWHFNQNLALSLQH